MTPETRRDLLAGLTGVTLWTAMVALRVFWIGDPPPTAAGLPDWAAVPGVAVVGAAIVAGLAAGLGRTSSRPGAWGLAISAVFLAVLAWTRMFVVEPFRFAGRPDGRQRGRGELLGEGLWRRRRG